MYADESLFVLLFKSRSFPFFLLICSPVVFRYSVKANRHANRLSSPRQRRHIGT